MLQMLLILNVITNVRVIPTVLELRVMCMLGSSLIRIVMFCPLKPLALCCVREQPEHG